MTRMETVMGEPLEVRFSFRQCVRGLSLAFVFLYLIFGGMSLVVAASSGDLDTWQTVVHLAVSAIFLGGVLVLCGASFYRKQKGFHWSADDVGVWVLKDDEVIQQYPWSEIDRVTTGPQGVTLLVESKQRNVSLLFADKVASEKLRLMHHGKRKGFWGEEDKGAGAKIQLPGDEKKTTDERG